MKKTVRLLAGLLLLCFLFTGCAFTDVKSAKDKTFTKDGITLTLTSGFWETAYEGYTACYDSSKAAVFILKEPFSLGEGVADMTLTEYAGYVLTANADKSPTAVQTSDGLTFLEYTFMNETEKENFQYFTTLFKGPDAFWLVQFGCAESLYEEYKPYFIKWAQTVRFGA